MNDPRAALTVFARRWGPFLLIFASCFLLYAKTLFFGTVHYDDHTLIQRAAAAGPGDILTHNVFLEESRFYYRPLMAATFWANARIGGTAPVGYHLTNLVLHITAVYLLWIVLQRLGTAPGSALFLALAFATHPLLGDAVAWIPGRNDLLLGCCIFSAFLTFLDHVRRPTPGTFWLHGLFFCAALATKETAVVFPMLCLLYRFCIDGRESFDRMSARFMLLWTACLGLFLAARNGLVGGQDIMPAQQLGYLLRDLPALGLYLANTLVPVDLHLRPELHALPWPRMIAAGAVLAGIGAALPAQRQPLAAFGLAWFTLFLLPTLTLHDAVFQGNRAYVPMMGIAVVLGPGIERLRALRLSSRLLPLAGTAAVLTLAIGCFLRTDAYFSPLRFWKTAAAEQPLSAKTAWALGTRLRDVYGMPGAAIVEFRRALELDPGLLPARNDLAALYIRLGWMGHARELLEGTVRAFPGDATAWRLWGDTTTGPGAARAALKRYTAALVRDPKDAIAQQRIRELGPAVRMATRAQP